MGVWLLIAGKPTGVFPRITKIAALPCVPGHFTQNAALAGRRDRWIRNSSGTGPQRLPGRMAHKNEVLTRPKFVVSDWTAVQPATTSTQAVAYIQ